MLQCILNLCFSSYIDSNQSFLFNFTMKENFIHITSKHKKRNNMLLDWDYWKLTLLQTLNDIFAKWIDVFIHYTGFSFLKTWDISILQKSRDNHYDTFKEVNFCLMEQLSWFIIFVVIKEVLGFIYDGLSWGNIYNFWSFTN